MTVITVFTEEKEVDTLKAMSENTRNIFLQNVCVNSNANIIYSEEKKKEIRSGNQSECGLLKFVMKEGESYEKYRSMFSDAKSVAFSSDRKRMSTVYTIHGDKKFARVCVKGQASIILERCVSIVGANGEVKLLTQEDKQ